MNGTTRHPAVVVIAFNRVPTLERLLASLRGAEFPAEGIVPLVISVDASDTAEVVALARRFEWPFGPKEVVAHDEHLGLREHVLRCGNLAERFGSIIMLEDDVTVAPVFYRYARQVLDFYGSDDRIAGISLYTYEVHPYGFVRRLGVRFEPLHDGFDNWFALLPSSWGQCWTARQWKSFRTWLGARRNEPVSVDLPKRVRDWPASSWKKLFNEYQLQTGRWFVFPRVALSTNWGDAGTHFSIGTTRYQSALQFRGTTWRFSRLEESLARYDAHLELLPECIRAAGALGDFDFATDFYAMKDAAVVRAPYVLTVRDATPVLRSFGASLRPMELNVIAAVPGSELRLVSRQSWLESLGKPLPTASRGAILAHAPDRLAQAAIVERERRRRTRLKRSQREVLLLGRTANFSVLTHLLRFVDAWRLNRREQRRAG